MKKKQLKAQADLVKKRNWYKKDLGKVQFRIGQLRSKLTQERNREQYLNRCISALNTRIGDINEGQLEFLGV